MTRLPLTVVEAATLQTERRLHLSRTVEMPASYEHGEVCEAIHQSGGRWAFFADPGPGFGAGHPFGAPDTVGTVFEPWRPVMHNWESLLEFEAGGTAPAPDRDKVLSPYILAHGGALRFAGAKALYHTERWHSAEEAPEWASRATVVLTEQAVRREEGIWTWLATAVLVGGVPVKGGAPF